MTRETKALRKALWQNMRGCTCKPVIMVRGKAVVLKADEVCSPTAVRCNGRHNRIIRDYKKHGLKIGPVGPGESGLAE
jgi:hypothetical protein